MRSDAVLSLGAAMLLALGIGVSLSRSAGPVQSVAPAPPTSPTRWAPRSLRPVANLDPSLPPQPARCRPYHLVATPDGRTVYVTLAGTELQPGDELAVVDVATRRETARIRVGSQPYGAALHPSGRWILVTNRFSNFLSIVDAAAACVVGRIPVPTYCEDVVVAADGRTAYLANAFLDQVLVLDLKVEQGALAGRLRTLGYDRRAYLGQPEPRTRRWAVCRACGYRTPAVDTRCARCDHGGLEIVADEPLRAGQPGGLHGRLRVRCGTAGCHLYPAGGLVVGPDAEQSLASVIVHAFPRDPDSSPLLRAVLPVRRGGWADGTSGYHHAGGVVFAEPERDPDYRLLRAWIARGTEGPGISVGSKPRDMALSPDGRWLFVANTATLDISVVDLRTLRETRRIQTRSPVNDLAWVDGKLVLATLGVGSGHPKAHHPGRESTDRDHPEAEFTLFRDPRSGSPRPLPLAQQQPLGPYDDVDGTAQQKFRDITNDIVLLDPATASVARYAASEAFTRYTSDSFEALAGDVKGDVPPALMKVKGAFPEQLLRVGERLYVTMSGTFEVQEWRLALDAAPVARLVPERVFSTGIKPTGLAHAAGQLVVANHLDESLSFIDLKTGQTSRLSLSRLAEPFPATDFERGELFVQTSVFSVDQDQSCVHCHYRDTSDGQKWSVSQVMGQNRAGKEVTGGSREVPDLRALIHKVPFFVEGILSIDEPLTMMMEHNPLVDFQGRTPIGDWRGIRATDAEAARPMRSADMLVAATGRGWTHPTLRLVDLAKRRELFFRRQTRRYFGRAFGFRDLQRFIGAYQRGEPRLLPNPLDPADPMVRHGRELFESPQVGCSRCHPAPTFTDKVHVHNGNKSFPPLVSTVARDNIHTLISADYLDRLNGFVRSWDKDDPGRFEEREGQFVAPSLHGLWDRPPRFLHHGRAISLREVICTPGHPALRRLPFPRLQAHRPGRWEIGLNERDGLFDTHGTTSHLSIWDIECLVKYLRSIE